MSGAKVILRFWLVMVLSVVSFVYVGCSHAPMGPKSNETSSPGVPKTGPVERTKENLSMAGALKRIGSSEYVLGPQDKVQISVFGHDELGMETTISPTGMMPYFLIGQVQAGGMTSFELRDKIQEKLAKYIRDPRVVVQITEHRSKKVIVLGQIRNPGVYPMKGDLTLLEAISSAGGVTTDAYLGGAYVVRQGKVLLVNFYELIEKGNTSENIPLLAGDVIYIPDNRDHKVFVLGEVNKQSAVQMRENMTFLEAVAEAGGFTKDANKKTVLIMRGNLSEPEILKINADALAHSSNIPLKQGDVIYVASTGFADMERIAVRISHILKPFLDVARGVILYDTGIKVLESGTQQTITINP